MKIDVYCNDGSPLNIDPTFIDGRGVGGAELSLMTWAEVMASRGHSIRIYNNPPRVGFHGDVEYLMQSQFIPNETRDAFVTWRSPSRHTQNASANIKIFWSCDQKTVGNFERDVFPFVDKTVCISAYHVAYHKNHYHVDPAKIGYFDLGVRESTYQSVENGITQKTPYKCIWCSVPGRGLDILARLWPNITNLNPDVSLVITSDYRLWGSTAGDHQFRIKFMGMPNVEYLGAIPRPELAVHQLQSDLTLGSFTYEELFGISMAEGQYTGALPISGSFGSLPDVNRWGEVIYGDPGNIAWGKGFTETVTHILGDRDALQKRQAETVEKAKKRFSWNTICEKWEKLIETGEYS